MSDESKNKKRGVFGWAWYGATYLVRRPTQDIARSAHSLGNEWAAFRQTRAKRQALIQAERSSYEERSAGLSPSERFAAEAARGGWTAETLRNQEASARLARRASLVLCALGFTACLAGIAFAPLVFVLLFSIVAMALLAGCFAMAVRNAWWEFELQGRVLIPLRDFLSRPDLFRRLFS